MATFALTERGGCPLCGTQDASIYIPFREIPIRECANCGFTFSGKVLSDDDLTSYYENTFGGLRHKQGQMVNALVNCVVLDRLLGTKKLGRVLDVGTGYGFLLKALNEMFEAETFGVELSKQEADIARHELGLNVVNSSLADSGLPKAHFDLVTSFEVIEHVPDPLHFLSEMAEYVKPGGYLLVMTDNFHGRMARKLGPSFPKWIPHAHINHFSPDSLKATIGRISGLTLKRAMSYTPWEVKLRAAYYSLRGISKTPEEAFDLASTLAHEMTDQYRMFYLRKLFNKIWVRMTLSDNLDGDMMYFAAQKNLSP